VPDGSAELLLYQTLLGAWPLRDDALPAFAGRLHEYLVKASREAKEHTSWLHPDAVYEEALTKFADLLLAGEAAGAFPADFREFQRCVAFFGAVNALAQVLLKVAAPGVPDFSQGTELWDFSLVDPDNRRSVDFSAHARLLAALDERAAVERWALLRELLANWEDGRVKLYLTSQALRFRRARADLFVEGDYVPLGATGARREHVVAFARRRRAAWAVVVVPRLSARLAIAASRERTSPADVLPPRAWPIGLATWGETAVRLPASAPVRWRDALSGAEAIVVNPSSNPAVAPALSVGAVLREFPVALLVGEPE
jgi:(1->4)-alpha-D-glucan 1-alpha-D-glucosylmutase